MRLVNITIRKINDLSTNSFETLKNTYNINTDILEGSTIFVEQGSQLQWNTKLMSNVWIYNGYQNSSFKTISFQTTTGKTQVLLGFAVYDTMGTLISQIGAKGRFNILDIQYNTNLSQYNLSHQKNEDKDYATGISAGTNGDKFEMNFTPQSDLVIVPVVSDLGYTIFYECTSVYSTYYTLKSSYSASNVARQSKRYDYRLTCMSYSVDSISAQWDCFTVYGYYDGYIDVKSNYCPDTDSQVVTYTLTHDKHDYGDLSNVNCGHYSSSDSSCTTYDWYGCYYCDAQTEKAVGIKHKGSKTSDTWSNDKTYHWRKVTCTNTHCTDPHIRDEYKGSHASAGWDSDQNSHKCKTCGYKEDHDWTDYELNKAIDCLTDEYISKCTVCEKTRTETRGGNNHKYNGEWKEGTALFKDNDALRNRVSTYDHIKYRTCSVCGNSNTFRIVRGSSIDACSSNGTLSNWQDAVRSKVGYDMVRSCPCGGKQTHTHGETLDFKVEVETINNAANGYWKFDDDGTACRANISFYNVTVSCSNCPKSGGLSGSVKYAVISNATKHYVSRDTVGEKLLEKAGQAANAVIEAGVTIWNKTTDAVVKFWNALTGQDVENSVAIESSAVAKIPFVCENCYYTILNPLLNANWTIDTAGWKLKDYLIELEKKKITKYSDEFAKFLPKDGLWDQVQDYINKHY